MTRNGEKKTKKRNAASVKKAYYRAADSLHEDNKRRAAEAIACFRHLSDLKREYCLAWPGQPGYFISRKG